LDAGEEKIVDESLAAGLRKKAAGIRARALLAAALITLLFFMV
jgi:hypothetical protein